MPPWGPSTVVPSIGGGGTNEARAHFAVSPASPQQTDLGAARDPVAIAYAPQRPTSAGPERPGCGGRGRPLSGRRVVAGGAHHASTAQGRQPAPPRQGLTIDVTNSIIVGGDTSPRQTLSKHRPDRSLSASRSRGLGVGPAAGRDAAVASTKDGNESMSGLMLAVLQVYEHRTSADLWARILEPLRSIVPCEDAKVVVRSIGPPPAETTARGPFDPDVRWRSRAVNYVEQWNTNRIEGQAATSQRILRIPSQDATRLQWDQYEVGRSNTVGSGTTASLRCLVAVPLFDADGNVLAVVKLVNRRTPPDGHPAAEFSRADLTLLSAFSAIFACVIPSPYLGLPGTGLHRRPQARILVSDTSITAVVNWQAPRELTGTMAHEILYGELNHEDEYSMGRAVNKEHWNLFACGILSPLGGPDESELRFESQVPGLDPDTVYAFSVRFRSSHTALDWSEPSAKLPTYLVPPHLPESTGPLKLYPISESTVELEWVPFRTCDPGLQLIEYRVVAQTTLREDSSSEVEDGVEQVVALFISQGDGNREMARVSNLQPNATYTFAVEARYPYIGPRDFARVVISEPFSFPTVDIALPAPQPLLADAMEEDVARSWAELEHPTPLLIQWPFPPDLSSQLVMQCRTASVAAPSLHESRCGDSSFPRLSVSSWNNVRSADCVQAHVYRAEAASEVRILRDANLESRLAVQLRVVKTPHGTAVSPPSSWFFPDAPAPPQSARTDIVVADGDGLMLQVSWQARCEQFWDVDQREGAAGRDLGPVGFAVRHDFVRGNGPCPTRFQLRIRAVTYDGEPRGDWTEFPPSLMPQAEAYMDGCSGHRYFLREQRWFVQAGSCWEVQLRHSNALFWSRWAPGGRVTVQVAPPTPALGSSLVLEDVRSDSVRLEWYPFLSSEPKLRALEYKISCLELPMGTETRPENGGRLVAWRTIDTVVADGEQPSAVVAAGGPLSYIVRSLLPTRRYHFAVECRYVGLPPELAERATTRLETTSILPSREFRLSVLTEGASADILMVGSKTDQAAGLERFAFRIEWRFRIQPLTNLLPTNLSYQLACRPADSDDTVASLILPPMLMSERNRADGGASFFIDRSREMFSGTAELCAGCLEPLAGSRVPLQLAIRVGDPNSGAWSAWMENLGSPIQFALDPPVPAAGDTLAVAEKLWDTQDTSAPQPSTPHAVEELELVWRPFCVAPETSAAQHAKLALQYEVSVWSLDRGLVDDRIRTEIAAARTNEDAVAGARVEMRRTFVPEVADDCLHKLKIRADLLHSSLQYFFRITARYLFADGSGVPVPPDAYESTSGRAAAALISSKAYSALPHHIPAPTFDLYSSPYDEAADRCALLCLPPVDRGLLASEPLIIDCREGYVQAGCPEGDAIRVASVWEPIPKENLEPLPGNRPRVLVVGLRAALCQFRVRHGRAESEASAWLDTMVWCPSSMQQASQLNSSGTGPLDITEIPGLDLSLGLSKDGSLHARLVWPRNPPVPCAVSLQRYQVRYRSPGAMGGLGAPWEAMPVVDLPRDDTIHFAECQLKDLHKGGIYEFSIRICNALGRWSDWSAPKGPLKLELPPPTPPRGDDQQQSGLRLAMVTSTAAKLCWRPFTIPRRANCELQPPLALEADELGTRTIPAEYEMAIREDGGGVIALLQREAVALLEEVPPDCEPPWLEAEVPLQPHKAYVFALRARLRAGVWGQPVISPVLPARLMPIAVGTPLVELTVRPQASISTSFETMREHRPALEAAIHVEAGVRGFRGVLEARGGRSELSLEMDRTAAELVRCQVRSRPAKAHDEDSWTEWPVVDARSSYNPVEHLMQLEIPLQCTGLPAAGGEFVFCVRCGDDYDRWTAWSNPSEPEPIRAPALCSAAEAERKEAGSCLRLTPLGPSAVLLEWSQFRPRWSGVAAQKGLEMALQRIAYSIRMTRRLAKSTCEWTSAPVFEMVSERTTTGTLSHEVKDLDQRFEYVFHVAARWVDVPAILGIPEYAAEISSQLLHARLDDLQAPEKARVEVVASESEGLYLTTRWYPNISLRDGRGLPVPGARYQLRIAEVPAYEVRGPSPPWEEKRWQVRRPVLDDAEDASTYEAVEQVHGLSVGSCYCVSVRVGDQHRWSGWSEPSDPVALAVAPPVPRSGDVLELAAEHTADAIRLEWRPFPTTSNLARIEYKVMALEWPCEDRSAGWSAGAGAVCARLRRVADMAQAGSFAGVRSFRPVGYVHRQFETCSALRAQTDRLEWCTEGLRPGMYYRFFVCARYAGLPSGALGAPPGLPVDLASDAPVTAANWPDEHCERLRGDAAVWETALGRFGIWSSVVNTLHLPPYVVRGVSDDLLPPRAHSALAPAHRAPAIVVTDAERGSSTVSPSPRGGVRPALAPQSPGTAAARMLQEHVAGEAEEEEEEEAPEDSFY